MNCYKVSDNPIMYWRPLNYRNPPTPRAPTPFLERLIETKKHTRLKWRIQGII